MFHSNKKLQRLILISIFASIIGILAQITIPIPLIPITGQTLAIGLAATILGAKHSTYAVLLYCLMGTVGIPVFSGFSAGPGVLLGPTGGFIIGFIPTAFIIGYILEKTSFRFHQALATNIAGMIVTLAFGTAWYKISTEVSWSAALAAACLPFIIPGLIKAYIASVLGITVRKRLQQARLITV